MVHVHILYADGDRATRDGLAEALRRDPLFVARGCASGDEVLRAALEWRPDLALLDVAIPGIGGPGLLERLRADRRTAAIPVVFMAARALPRDCAQLKGLGAAGVIAKPFDAGQIAATVRRFLPLEGALAAARSHFLRRLDADASALSSCRAWLAQAASEPVLRRINQIAHALAGAGGIYGFAGITSESATLCDVAENSLAGRAGPIDVEHALDRLLRRIQPN